MDRFEPGEERVGFLKRALYWLRDNYLDVAGYGLALIYGLPALYYPFGRDQALYDYVGRGLLHGLLPYADTFDHKPPLLYVFYAIGALLPLPPMMGVRVVELFALLALGPLIARLVEREPGQVPGGAVSLAMVAVHYSNFDWWHTAQSEVWEALLMVAAAAAALRGRGTRGGLLAGVLAGLSTGCKPTALLMAAVVAGVVALRGEGRRARAFLAFVLGGLAVGLLLVLPWALAGKLRALWEVVVLYNEAHALSDAGHSAWDFVLDHLLPTLALALPALLALLTVLRRPALLARGLLLLLLTTAASLSVVAQQKYYAYHFSVISPFLLAQAVWGVAVLVDLAATRWSGLAARRQGLGLLLALLLAAGATWRSEQPRVGTHPPWVEHVANVAHYLTGGITRPQFLARYRSRHISPYVVADIDRLSRRIVELAEPGDTLCVRGYEPGFYTLTGLWCPSRFSADFALYDKDIHFPLRDRWQREHEEVLASHPPTFVVTFDGRAHDKEALEAAGYRRGQRYGRYILYTTRPAPVRVPP